MTQRQNLEVAFESLGRQIVRWRWIVIPVMLAFAASLSSQAPKITVDTSAESFLHDDDPAKQSYNEFRDQFGRDELIIAAVHTPDALDPDFLLRLRDFHNALEEEVPHLEEVRSLINARVTRGEGDRLIVEDLLEEWPETPSVWLELREYVLANKLYANLLISPDARLTTVSIESSAYSSEGIEEEIAFETLGDAVDLEPLAFLSGAENAEFVRATRSVVERFQGAGFEIQINGAPVLQDQIASAIQHNMIRFIFLMVLIIASLLLALFRRLSGVILPLVVVAPVVSGTIGSMAIAGEFLSAPTQILPSLLLAVGIGAAVHILTIIFPEVRCGRVQGRRYCPRIGALGRTGMHDKPHHRRRIVFLRHSRSCPGFSNRVLRAHRDRPRADLLHLPLARTARGHPPETEILWISREKPLLHREPNRSRTGGYR